MSLNYEQFFFYLNGIIDSLDDDETLAKKIKKAMREVNGINTGKAVKKPEKLTKADKEAINYHMKTHKNHDPFIECPKLPTDLPTCLKGFDDDYKGAGHE